MKRRVMKKALTAVCFFFGVLLLFSVGIAAEDSDARYDAFCETLREGILLGEEEISVELLGIYTHELSDLFVAFLAENPEYSFCISRSYRYTYSQTTNQVKLLKVTYDDRTTVAVRKARIEAEIDRIAAEIDPSWDDLYKLLWINNYICDHYRYELEETEYHDVYNFLLHKEGVCEAYTALFTLLAREAGFEVSFCRSDALNHIWNLVKLDGAWYHVDTTWNDLYSERYEYFLLSDAANTEARAAKYGAFDTFARHTADSFAYDAAFWRNGFYCAVSWTDAGYYCIEGQTLYRVDLEALTLTAVADVGTHHWKVPSRPSSIYLDTYHDTLGYGELLVYSTPSAVYARSMETGAQVTVYENAHTYEIFGLAKDGNDLIVIHYNPETESEYWQTVEGYFRAPTAFCTLTFLTDGVEYEKLTVAVGSAVQLPSTPPSKDSDVYYDYVFDGWAGYTDGMMAGSDSLTFVASYRAIPRQYTVSFYDGERLLQSNSYVAGTAFSAVTLPTADPVKQIGEIRYRFVGWGSTPLEIVSHVTLTAVYEAIPCYTVTYYNGDEVFDTQRVEEGTLFAPIAGIPSRATSATHRFQFERWVGFTVGDPVTADISLRAEYRAIPLEETTEETEETTETADREDTSDSETVEESQSGTQTEEATETDTARESESRTERVTSEEETETTRTEDVEEKTPPAESILYGLLAIGLAVVLCLLAAVILKFRR